MLLPLISLALTVQRRPSDPTFGEIFAEASARTGALRASTVTMTGKGEDGETFSFRSVSDGVRLNFLMAQTEPIFASYSDGRTTTLLNYKDKRYSVERATASDRAAKVSLTSTGPMALKFAGLEGAALVRDERVTTRGDAFRRVVGRLKTPETKEDYERVSTVVLVLDAKGGWLRSATIRTVANEETSTVRFTVIPRAVRDAVFTFDVAGLDGWTATTRALVFAAEGEDGKKGG